LLLSTAQALPAYQLIAGVRGPAAPQAAEQESESAAQAERSRGRFELSAFESAVNHALGHWNGGGAHLFLKASSRVELTAEGVVQRRPGDREQLGVFGATVHWTRWFSTQLSASGGGPDEPEAFYPRLRYDATGTVQLPVPGMLLTGGWTRVYFGNPVSGRIARAGLIQYAGRFVLQGNVNFYNSRPGNRKSVSGNGAAQYGREGSYWVGMGAGGGREAWQMQGAGAGDIEFTGYNLSFFARKWITPDFGLVGTYNYFLKREAYRYNGVELRAFWQF
jgi:YaiO family outer membrane protein